MYDCTHMHQLPQENLGCCKQLYTFHPPTVGKGTRQCHISAASYSRPQEEGKECTIICGIPGFPEVVSTCACNTFFLLLLGLGTRLGSYILNVCSYNFLCKFTVELIGFYLWLTDWKIEK